MAEGAALVGTAFLLGRWQMRAFGLGVLVVGLGHLVVIDLLEQGGRIDLDEFVPFPERTVPHHGCRGGRPVRCRIRLPLLPQATGTVGGVRALGRCWASPTR